MLSGFHSRASGGACMVARPALARKWQCGATRTPLVLNLAFDFFDHLEK
jgi:hypothetical protein